MNPGEGKNTPSPSDSASVPRDAAEPMPKTCPSCGAKDHALAWYGRHLRCDRCGEDQLHPIETTPLTFRTVLSECWAVLRAIGLHAVLLRVVAMLPASLLLWTAHPDTHFGILAIHGVLFLAIDGATIALGLMHLDQVPLRLGRATLEGIQRWPAILFTQIVATHIVLFHFLLLIVPGFYRIATYLLVLPLLMARDARSIDSLRESATRLKGHLQVAFASWAICFLPYALGTAGVYWWETQAGASKLGIQAITIVLEAILLLPAMGVSLVLHAKTRTATPATE